MNVYGFTNKIQLTILCRNKDLYFHKPDKVILNET